jgi:hypothetical protein
MANITELSAEQLRRAATIKDQIEKLQKELGSILGWNGSANGKASTGKRGPSPEAIERIRAAQKARWAKIKGTEGGAGKAASKPAARGKRAMSPAAKAKLAARMKEIWAKRKAAKAK